MKKVIKLKNSDIKKLVNLVIEQDSKNNVEWVEVSPERYLEIMKYAGYYARGVANLPEFRNKNIVITGTLKLPHTPTKSLDGIKKIEGNLDISNTQISNIDGIQIQGYVSDWNTPLRKIKEKRIRDGKLAEAIVRREDDEWRLDTGYGRANEEAYAAHAVLEYIISNGGSKIKLKTKKDLERLEELNELLENLQDKVNEYEQQDRDLTDVYTDIEIAEDEVEEINNKIDVYNLIPDGEHYDLLRFEVVGYDDLEGETYCAGKPYDAEESAKEYVRRQLDDGGYSNFNPSFVESFIDEDEVVDYFKDYYEDDIRNNPDVYFNDDDYELTEEQQERIEELENQIVELEEEQKNFEVDEPEDVSRLWDEIQEKIDALESEKDNIEPEIGNPTEEMIDSKLEDMLDSVRRNPVENLKDLGIDDLTNFINERDFIDGVVESDGVGIVSTYDGSYDVVYVNNEEFYVMRLD